MRNLILPGVAALALVAGAAMFMPQERHDPDAQAVHEPGEAIVNAEPETPPEDATVERVTQIRLDGSIEEVETEIVHGIRVRKDRNCTVQVRYIETSEGVVTKGYSCEPNEVREHPYDDYSNETLAELAYSDAEAAKLLGVRMSGNHEEALRLFARAAALENGSPEPIQYYSALSAGPVAQNGEPVAETLYTQLVLQTVAERLGKQPGMAEFWKSEIRSGLPNPDRVIDDAQAEAEDILAYMRDVQLTVTGRTTIGE